MSKKESVLKKLSHKSIPKYIGTKERDDEKIIIQQYQCGEQLERGIFDTKSIFKIAISIFELLVYLHSLPNPVTSSLYSKDIVVRKDLSIFVNDLSRITITEKKELYRPQKKMFLSLLSQLKETFLIEKIFPGEYDISQAGYIVAELFCRRNKIEVTNVNLRKKNVVSKLLKNFISDSAIIWLEKCLLKKYDNAFSALSELKQLTIDFESK